MTAFWEVLDYQKGGLGRKGLGHLLDETVWEGARAVPQCS